MRWQIASTEAEMKNIQKYSYSRELRAKSIRGQGNIGNAFT